jgi:hypothetical protein
MTALTFEFRGRQVTADEFKSLTAQPKKRVARSGPDAYHRGYRLVGHAPGAVKLAQEACEYEHQRYRNATPKMRIEAGMKEPKTWDEEVWRRTAPKKTIKAFNLHDSALQGAEIARKSGWTEVDVIELKKGERPEGWA